jgi:dipeptidyl aminopeptidase/acylaminoacyl peptidase
VKGSKLLLRDAVSNVASAYSILDETTNRLSPLFGQNEREEYSAIFDPKLSDVLVSTNKFENFKTLYRYRDGRWTRLSPELHADIEHFDIDPKGKRILMQINDRGYSKVVVLDAKTLKPMATPLDGMEKVHSLLGETSGDGRYTTFSVVTDKEPGTNMVMDWKTGQIQMPFKPASTIDTTKFAPASLEYYPARDGTLIPMFVRRPPGSEGKNLPVVVEFHGGPELQAVPGFNPFAQLYVDAGFIYVEPNVRGSSGYGKEWLNADNGAKRLDVITDIEDAAKFIRANWATPGKPLKIAVTGYSYGGLSALLGMSMFSGAYDVGVSVVGITNFHTFLNNTAPYRRALRISEYGDPQKDKDLLTQLSPTSYIEKIRGPLLMIQGVNDPRVPVGEALQYYNAFQSKNMPTSLVLLPGEGHETVKNEGQIMEWGHIIQFLKTHLK